MRPASYSFLAAFLLVTSAVTASPQSGRARRVAPPPEPPVAKPDAPAGPQRNAPVPVEAKFDTKYAGGSLGFERDAKVTITIKDGTIGIATKNTHYEVAAEKITDMSYGTNVRQRTAEAIGVGTVVPGLGGIIGNSKSTAHYIEITWDVPPSGGVALRVDKDDYRGLIAALEGATGLQVRMEPAQPVKDFP
jgi:hypothetical protein